jgi:pectinesterase inhibitor-like protein
MAYVAAAVFSVVSLTALFAGGEACNNVASMTWTAACQQTDRWEKLCQQTLQGTAPDTAEVTVYALIATRLAKSSYEETLAELDSMLGAGNLPGAERLAIDNCKEKYSAALSKMAGVVDHMPACDFSLASKEYIDAEAGVRSCQEGLQPYQFLPLFAKVSTEHDLTLVAYLLGAIIVGR